MPFEIRYEPDGGHYLRETEGGEPNPYADAERRPEYEQWLFNFPVVDEQPQGGGGGNAPARNVNTSTHIPWQNQAVADFESYALAPYRDGRLTGLGAIKKIEEIATAFEVYAQQLGYTRALSGAADVRALANTLTASIRSGPVTTTGAEIANPPYDGPVKTWTINAADPWGPGIVRTEFNGGTLFNGMPLEVFQGGDYHPGSREAIEAAGLPVFPTPNFPMAGGPSNPNYVAAPTGGLGTSPTIGAASSKVPLVLTVLGLLAAFRSK